MARINRRYPHIFQQNTVQTYYITQAKGSESKRKPGKQSDNPGLALQLDVATAVNFNEKGSHHISLH